jgi:hypothetical protein
MAQIRNMQAHEAERVRDLRLHMTTYSIFGSVPGDIDLQRVWVGYIS